MTDVVIPLVVGFGGVFAGIAFSWGRLVFERGRRRRTLVAALSSEATSHGTSLWRLLHEHPRSENMAYYTDRFYSKVTALETAGDIFLANLPAVDVLQPPVVRKLADAYADLRAAAREAASLTEVGSGSTPMGITWALKDRLVGIVGQLREAVLLLNDSR